MVFKGTKGKITLLRANDLGHVWGPPGDRLETEVVVRLDSAPDMGFGIDLKPGDQNLPSRLAMLSLLRDAYVHDLTVEIGFNIDEGKKNGHLTRIQFDRSIGPIGFHELDTV
jgi:hypothetical protein